MLFFDSLVSNGRNPIFEDYYQNIYLKNCSYKASFFEDPHHYAAITSAIATAVFPIHVVAFYCILYKTPKIMDGIKTELLILHCWTFYCDNCLNVFLIGYLFAPMFCGVPLGILNYYGVPVVVIGYLGQIGVSGVGTSLVILFETRYTAVSLNNIFKKWMKAKKMFIAANYIYTATFLIPAFCVWTPDDRQIQEKMNVLKVIPCPSPIFFEDKVVVGFPPEYTWIAFYCCTVFSVLIIIQIGFFVGNTIYRNYFKVNLNLSKKTIELQKKLFRCICIQVAIPTVALFIPAIYICFSIQISYYDQTINNVLVILFSSHGTLTSLSTILTYHHYRKVLISIFTCGQSNSELRSANVIRVSNGFLE